MLRTSADHGGNIPAGSHRNGAVRFPLFPAGLLIQDPMQFEIENVAYELTEYD
jgi:hypothetical protein